MFYPCRSELFNHRSRSWRTRRGLSLGQRQEMLASCYGQWLHLPSQQSHRQALHWPHQQPVSGVTQHKEGVLQGFTTREKQCLTRGSHGHQVRTETRSCLGLGWSKSSKQHGHDKHRRGSLGYARDKLFDSAPSSAASPDKSMRRSAQDDDFVRVFDEKHLK